MSDRATASSATLPENGLGSLGGEDHREPTKLIAKIQSLRARLDEKVKQADRLHQAAAPVMACVFDAFSKDAEVAELLRETDKHISDKRSGERGSAAWELITLLAAKPEAFLALARLYCALHGFEPPQPKKKVVRADLAEMALQLLSAGPLLTLLVGEAERRRGASEAEVIEAMQDSE